jgi:hypothetical protein
MPSLPRSHAFSASCTPCPPHRDPDDSGAGGTALTAARTGLFRVGPTSGGITVTVASEAAFIVLVMAWM